MRSSVYSDFLGFAQERLPMIAKCSLEEMPLLFLRFYARRVRNQPVKVRTAKESPTQNR
jgi:hypothetical protein